MKIIGKTIYKNYLEKSDKDYINFIFTFFEDNNNIQFKLRGNLFKIEDLELFIEKVKNNESCSLKQKYNNDENMEIIYQRELEYFIFNYKYVSIRYKKNVEIINLFNTFYTDIINVN